MTHGNYGKIERGEIEVGSAHLIQIAKVLKVNVGEFFDDHVPSFKENKNPNYGYASKADVENLSHLVHSLIKEVEKLRGEIHKAPARKTAKPK